MPGKLHYVPLESYIQRYSCQWSAPKRGWVERRLIEYGVPYVRIEGEVSSEPRVIKAGCVLDAVGRSTFCFSQVSKLLHLAESGELASDDTILFDDYWTPGIEALPYTFSLMGLKPKMYAFFHAQSVDQYDFTAAMLPWIRHFEKGIANVLNGIFVCCHTLKDCVVNGGDDKSGMQYGGLCTPDKVYATGHPIASDEIMERMPEWYRVFANEERHRRLLGAETIKRCYHPYPTRKNQVVWSSRWDREKQPDFFLKVAEKVIEKQPYAKFVICTSAPQLRSNDPSLLSLLSQTMTKYPNNFELKEGLSKEAYYAILCESKVQTNHALQDWIAITLLEASVAGCVPVYPNFRSFPEAFRNKKEYMYEPWDADEAASMICGILDRDDLWSAEEIQKRSWMHTRFDTSLKRMLQVMGFVNGAPDDPYTY